MVLRKSVFTQMVKVIYVCDIVSYLEFCPDFQSCSKYHTLKTQERNFPGGPVCKNPPCNAGDVGQGIGRFLVRELRSHMPGATELPSLNY